MTLVSVYAVFADAGEAERIGRLLVEERLAACVNILAPCQSIYRWKGGIETGQEVPALFKTTRAMSDALVARLAELHSYDIPAITVWPAEHALGAYENWVAESVGGAAPG